MLAVKRRSEIQKLAEERKSVLVSDLAKLFEVTEETIRRDLNQLEQGGVVVRTYGGAYLKNSNIEDVDISKRRQANVQSKQCIAKISRSLIADGDTIFLDSSTTASYIASEVAEMQLTVVTNSLSITNLLSKYPNISLICLGGIYNVRHDAFVGNMVLKNLEKLFLDKAFISTHSLSMREGITDTNEEIATIRLSAAKRCRELYLAVGSEKFDRISFIKSLPYDAIKGVLTNSKPSDEWMQFFSQHGTEVYYRE